ncbi:cell division inhibitor SepF [Corynebacterium coyleae]|uniref:Cell division protein SepF n=1 Tax=Corynebacterium coyleae TaxID=53374 RepID=A0ABX8KY12_9CORY|nr:MULTISPECIES: cell division protein SepF [Corynebacterium]MDK6492326.1 cell division protein SepF [Corynebacterium coyleae]OFL17862.1 cell division protein SepF [Corynebacterium sp. HMSC067D03]OFT29185.1 cell division protein SepF [Corynebacterium sp. HMSC08F01]OHO81844.1 cell division protein SepF [Corynebacterium sp. HMSC036E10]OHQ53339.1 cell division protein SepF [Corynebacterium sp. HMSC070H05]
MSFFGSAKEFFGLGPIENNEDDAYFEDSRYSETSSTAGAGAYDRAERPSRYERDHREVSSTRASYRPTPRIVNVSPRNYNDAKEIGEPFRDGDAVVMDLTDLDTADAKRIVDFAAGLCFGLRGSMHNLSRGEDTRKRLFAIVPENANVDKDALKRSAGLR